MITTNCSEINWMAGKSREYLKDEIHTTYQFRGSVPYRMMTSANNWMKANGAQYEDGRSRSGWGMVLEETIDIENKWHHRVSIHFYSGNFKSNATSVELMITIYDYALTDEDIAEIKAAA